MITIEEHEGLNAGLNKRFLKRFSLKNFVKLNKAMIAPHNLINKKDQKKGFGLIKKVTQIGLAPHTLLKKSNRVNFTNGLLTKNYQ